MTFIAGIGTGLLLAIALLFLYGLIKRDNSAETAEYRAEWRRFAIQQADLLKVRNELDERIALALERMASR